MIELIVTEIGMLVAFIVGYILGSNGKNSIQNPVKSYKIHKQKKQEDIKYEKEKEDLEITLQNINNYDGTGAGQKKYK